MRYEEAIARWGASKLHDMTGASFDWRTVRVSFFSSSSSWWGPESFEDAAMWVRLEAIDQTARVHDQTIAYDLDGFDMGAVIREVLEISTRPDWSGA